MNQEPPEFLNIDDGIKAAKHEWINNIVRTIPFGNRFLDESLGGIAPNDVVVLTSGTGIGKTHMAMLMASEMVNRGLSVAFFALEASKGEIHRRLLYKEIANLYYAVPKEKRTATLTWRDFRLGQQSHLYAKLIEPASEMMRVKYCDLHVMTMGGAPDMNANQFVAHSKNIGIDVDAFFLDHFHFLNFPDGESNESMSDAMKSILGFAKVSGKPVVIICHLRKKMNFKDNRLLMSIDDIHGTSNIAKMATVVITMSRHSNFDSNRIEIPTLVRILKAREEGALNGVTALMNFDVATGNYRPAYNLVKTTDGEEFEKIDKFDEIPGWAQLSTQEPKDVVIDRKVMWDRNVAWIKGMEDIKKQPAKETEL